MASFNLDDFAQTSLQQLERCRHHIQTMLEDAKQDAAKMADDAKQRGYDEGVAEARADIDQRIADQAAIKTNAQLQSLHQAVTRMHRQYDAWMSDYAAALTDMTIAATEKILRAEIAKPAAEDGDHVIARWAREALHGTRSANRLTLAVHPETLAEIGEQLDHLLAHPDLPEQSTVVPDQSLAVGDVVVRQDGGEIRAGLTDQLERLAELMR